MKNSQAISLAITYAVFSIILFLLQVIVAGGMVFSSIMGIVSLAAMIVLPIIFVRRERAAKGGVISFKEVFTTSFVGLLVGGLIGVAFTFIYVSYIDASYIDQMVYNTLETTKGLLEGSMGNSEVNDLLQKAEMDIRKGFTLQGLAQSTGIFIAVYLVLSLILGAAMKKENPLMSQDI